MKKEIADMWVAALRSGNYKQGINRLRNENNEFCCLGVLCDISEKGKWASLNHFPFYTDGNDWSSFSLPEGIRIWAEISVKNPSVKVGLDEYTLSHLNDGGISFEEIANYIEKYWETI